MAASIHAPAGSNLPPTKTSIEHFGTISEVLENFLFVVGVIMGHTNPDEKELQMRDGLLELLIAYQVIHRLRDLFALYDRPQVEGSPFPSSILLSIQLLVVLTSRSMTKYAIDRGSLPEATLGIENRGIKPDEVAESKEDCGRAHSVLNNGVIIPSAHASDDKSLDESCATKNTDELLSISKDSEKPTHMEIQSDLTKPEGSVVCEKLLIQNGQNNLVHNAEKQGTSRSDLKQPALFLFSAMSETGLVCLPSLLTAVLLQANNRLSSELGTYILPANFEEVATGVLMVLNNLALMDMTFIQRMLARPDLKMELFHLMSFLLSHCTSKWKVAVDQVGLLLLESLSLLGYFSLFHLENQAVLRWGKSPTILHKVCDLPFVFFSDSALMPVLASTLVAACYGCEQNKGIVLQELSMDMLHSLLKSCRNVLPSNTRQDDPLESNHLGSELKRSLGDTSLRPIRYNGRSTRVSLGKGSALGNAIRGGKIRSQRDLKATKTSEEMVQKHKLSAPSRPVRLHCWFSSEFIDRVEQFFSPKGTQVGSEV